MLRETDLCCVVVTSFVCCLHDRTLNVGKNGIGDKPKMVTTMGPANDTSDAAQNQQNESTVMAQVLTALTELNRRLGCAESTGSASIGETAPGGSNSRDAALGERSVTSSGLDQKGGSGHGGSEELLDRAEPEKVNKLIKTLGVPLGGFSPRSEKEYDDVLDAWVTIARGTGFPLRMLVTVILRIGSARTQRLGEAAAMQCSDFPTFRDELARAMFPQSRCLELVTEELWCEKRGIELEVVVSQF